MEPKIAPYGAWESPITAEKVATGSTSFSGLYLDGGNSYWCEIRPTNKGRYTIVKRDSKGTIADVTPLDFNVRTFVHEYGGGAFIVHQGVVYASSGSDHKIYKITPGKMPQALTCGKVRFADMQYTPYGLLAIGEENDENFLAIIDLETGIHKKIATGFDFYSSPAISKDGKKVAWLSWNRPNMPWDTNELWIADFDQGSLTNPHKVAGNGDEAIQQPSWSSDHTLYFVSDRFQGWWNIHRLTKNGIEPVTKVEAEIGGPLWTFGNSSYAFMGQKIVFTYNKNGISHLAIVDTKSLHVQNISRQACAISQLRSGENSVEFLESYPDQGEALVALYDKANYPSNKLYARELPLDFAYISLPEHIEYRSSDRIAYGFYYPPKNQDFQAPPEEKPPLIVMIHGGPTAQARGFFQWAKQYWTSRGFAILDVNYGGSTGYGRAYRKLLNKNWGIIDVEDCVNGALFLSKQGLADPHKLAIRGGSAGGYTTLAALAFKNTFKAGASHYGIADIEALAHDTHKFERWYMETLVGKYPEEKNIWQKRSPIHAVASFKAPLILFQGEDDPIVPKNQSIMIFEALKKQGIKTELHLYPEEQHGFRKSENIIHSLTKELEFYQEVFGLRKIPSKETAI